MNPVIFHLAFPVLDIPSTKTFYADGLSCQIGRETSNCIILNMYGHQIVAHVDKDITPQKSIYPRHFGLVFTQEADWEQLLQRAQTNNLKFRQAARERFVGEITEHRTFFLEDPSYNLLEFKFYRHEIAIFGAADFGKIGDLL